MNELYTFKPFQCRVCALETRLIIAIEILGFIDQRKKQWCQTTQSPS